MSNNKTDIKKVLFSFNILILTLLTNVFMKENITALLIPKLTLHNIFSNNPR